jgi:hypothetical protein
MRKDHKLTEPVKFSTLNQKLLKMGYSWTLEDRFGKEGHGIAYIIMRNFIPSSDVTLSDNIRFITWYFERAFTMLPLRSWRQGTIYIEDLGGVGMKNMGSNKDQKALTNAVTNSLPLRISNIYIINPGWIFKVLIKIAKFFMKAKIVQRVEIVDSKTLLEKVPKECVLTEFGGELKFSYEQWLETVAKEEKAKEEQQGSNSSSENGLDSKDNSKDNNAAKSPLYKGQLKLDEVKADSKDIADKDTAAKDKAAKDKNKQKNEKPVDLDHVQLR